MGGFPPSLISDPGIDLIIACTWRTEKLVADLISIIFDMLVFTPWE